MTNKEPRRDWIKARDAIARRPGFWVLVFPDTRRTFQPLIKRNEVRVLRELPGKVEARTTHIYTDDEGKVRCNGWLRFTPKGSIPSQKEPDFIAEGLESPIPFQKADKTFTSIRMETGEVEKIQKVASLMDLPVSTYVMNVIDQILDEGTDIEPSKKANDILALKVETEKWERLQKIATDHGTTRNKVIRHEVMKRVETLYER